MFVYYVETLPNYTLLSSGSQIGQNIVTSMKTNTAYKYISSLLFLFSTWHPCVFQDNAAHCYIRMTKHQWRKTRKLNDQKIRQAVKWTQSPKWKDNRQNNNKSWKEEPIGVYEAVTDVGGTALYSLNKPRAPVLNMRPWTVKKETWMVKYTLISNS